MSTTKIEWCDKSWNPITGCSPISEGCTHCYAKRMSYRLKGRYGYPKDDPFRVTFHPDRLNEPLHWKKPCRIFVCSMGDLFHENISFSTIAHTFRKMIEANNHTYFLLTKRPERVQDFDDWSENQLHHCIISPWQDHIWLGVSVENQRTADERIPILLQIPAAKRFVSVEAMLSEVNISEFLPQICPVHLGVHLRGRNCLDKSKEGSYLDWVICGGETGPKARPMSLEWARSLRDQCQAAGVPFFFKSWGDNAELNPNAKSVCMYGRKYLSDKEKHLLDGKKWREFPK